MIRYSDDYNPIREYWNKIQSGEEAVGAKIRKTYKKLTWDLNHPGEYFYIQYLSYIQTYLHELLQHQSAESVQDKVCGPG